MLPIWFAILSVRTRIHKSSLIGCSLLDVRFPPGSDQTTDITPCPLRANSGSSAFTNDRANAAEPAALSATFEAQQLSSAWKPKRSR